MSIDYYQRAALTDEDLMFGLSEDKHHIVANSAATTGLELVGGDPARVRVPALCRRMVAVATVWGPYGRDIALRHPGRCPDCAWILALHCGDVDAEIAAFTDGDVLDAAMIAERVGDLGAKVLTAIAYDPALAHCGQRLEPSQQSQLLGQASRHLPVVGWCEECCDIGVVNAHGYDTLCPAQSVTCAHCTVVAHGSWAGEWAGTLLSECTVAAPCSVLTTLADHYRVQARPGSARGNTAAGQADSKRDHPDVVG